MAHVTAIGSPNKAETAVFWVIFDVFGPILVIFSGRGETWRLEDIILCSEILNKYYLKKIKVFITCKQPLEASHKENSKVFGQCVTFVGSL